MTQVDSGQRGVVVTGLAAELGLHAPQLVSRAPSRGVLIPSCELDSRPGAWRTGGHECGARVCLPALSIRLGVERPFWRASCLLPRSPNVPIVGSVPTIPRPLATAPGTITRACRHAFVIAPSLAWRSRRARWSHDCQGRESSRCRSWHLPRASFCRCVDPCVQVLRIGLV